MRKKIVLGLCCIVGACSSSSVYTQAEQDQLAAAGVLDYAEHDCEYVDSVKVMLKGEFEKAHIEAYCGLIIEDDAGVNALLAAGIKDVQTYLDVRYFRAEYVERYIAYSKEHQTKKADEVILAVNLNLDEEPYENITIIKDYTYDMLINKHYGLAADYVPDDLVDIKYTCTNGKEYSCADVEQQQLRKEAAKAYEAFVEAAAKEDIQIVAIAAYRSYAYQEGLYNYNLQQYGQAYADTYYARPGHSEHNSGLALDITFNDHDFNEIENYEGYDWILQHLHEYGFILRYPADKEDITQYGYESWHLRYVGKDVATYLYENKLTLDEYQAMK